MEVRYQSSQRVDQIIASLGRTEDVSFSPSSLRLAVAAFTRNRIAVFDVEISTCSAAPHIALTAAAEFSSPALNLPHGVDFLDEDTLIVANREGSVAIFELPADNAREEWEILPIETWPAGGTAVLQSPGSVRVAGTQQGVREVLICNNSGHTVTRHLLDGSAGSGLRSSEIFLRKWLAGPDGVAVSSDRRWVAVSNHETHSVLLYQQGPSLTADSDPDGILRCVTYPHGLRFSADGYQLFVADAGAPYVHVYSSDAGHWHGVRKPVASIRIMDQPRFARGQHNPQEGGPKGLDIDVSSRILVVSCESLPLAFFNARAMLEGYAPEAHDQTLDLQHELMLMRQKGALLNELDDITRSKAWRLTAPLRRLNSLWRRFSAAS